MIIEEGKYYLYRHIRLDKNEPFYIGIGTKRISKNKGKSKKVFKSHSWIYDRAYSKIRKTSKIWNFIVKKTKFEVEILLESDDLNFIREKEKEFIKLYGRIDLKTGCLANMTPGGEMNSNPRKMNKEERIRRRNHSSCKSVVKLNSDYEIVAQYKSSREASRENNVARVGGTCRNKCRLKNGFTYRYLEDYLNKKSELRKTENRKIVLYNEKEWVLHEFCKYVYEKTGIKTWKTYRRIKKGETPEECFNVR